MSRGDARQHVFKGRDSDELREQRRAEKRAAKKAAGLCTWSDGCRAPAAPGRTMCEAHAQQSKNARESRVVDLLSRGMRIRDVAEYMGQSVGWVNACIQAVEQRIGRRIQRAKHGRSVGCMTKEQIARASEIDRRLAAQPTCRRCGLRGEHECVPDITAFSRTGVTNLGACSFPVGPAK